MAISSPDALMPCPFCKAGSITIGHIQFPMAFMARYEAQAQRNHSQTLARLAQRGGVSWGEAAAIIEGKSWGSIKETDGARKIVEDKYAAWIVDTRPSPTVPEGVVEAMKKKFLAVISNDPDCTNSLETLTDGQFTEDEFTEAMQAAAQMGFELRRVR